jgi:hypothetical protein
MSNERRCVVENIFALAVQDMHSSCSETSERAFSRVRPVIPAVLSATVQGTTLPSAAFVTTSGLALGYGMPQTDDTDKAPISGYLTWSPPV